MQQKQIQNRTPPQLNTQAVNFELQGEAGRRVTLAVAKRIIKTHSKEIKALAYK